VELLLDAVLALWTKVHTTWLLLPTGTFGTDAISVEEDIPVCHGRMAEKLAKIGKFSCR
jgi:hypothetical protein